LTYRHFTDPYFALARASAVTSKIKLCTGITLVPERNPLVLTNEIAALHHYSKGHFIFSVT
jgi:alkanesulfonate monooxygenase SsuD/methylene tetrahydromethanopterin reductase-like flavin-dependent oxidoreductase (luciferase family)